MEAKMPYPKDPDAIKLFVGQIPKEYGEPQVRELLEQFGPINDVTIIKDKVTGIPKGCAFVTFASKQSALEAQGKLHEKRTLPGMNHPMQVKQASVSNKEPAEMRRLFVGMLSKSITEDDIKTMFTPYGTVEDASILRTPDGESKGAAFVRMGTRLQAQSAIHRMNQSQTLPGASGPINVKIADTEKEKEQKKLFQMLTQNPMPPALAYYNQVNEVLQLQSQLHQAQVAAASPTENSYGLGTGAVPTSMMTLSNQSGSTAGAYRSTQGLGNLGSAVLSAAANNPSQKLMNEQLMQMYGMPQFSTFAPQPQITQYVHQKQREGPDGANLFIYHLPNDVKDNDLVQLFAPYGNVLSAKVFVDKFTNLSKCFGFVSYDNPQSSHAAIRAMNGYQLGGKRLKVQLKRPKDTNNKPYW